MLESELAQVSWYSILLCEEQCDCVFLMWTVLAGFLLNCVCLALSSSAVKSNPPRCEAVQHPGRQNWLRQALWFWHLGLSDWLHCKNARCRSDEALALFSFQSISGTSYYLAPERIDPEGGSSPSYGVKADVWSLGITLLEVSPHIFCFKYILFYIYLSR